ncbi:MAG: hypothetical protein CM15mP79_0820 [Methanobacteriota archaeon]|nr:MAG: hypothetical protein CM15mP79_0820 [Euryarchaeota archaeon]
MDAVPLTLGQEAGGWVAQLTRTCAASPSRSRTCTSWRSAARRGHRPEHASDFAERVAAPSPKRPACPSSPAPNKFAQLAAHDAVVAASGAFTPLPLR